MALREYMMMQQNVLDTWKSIKLMMGACIRNLIVALALLLGYLLQGGYTTTIR
jgi:hypothetical protein